MKTKRRNLKLIFIFLGMLFSANLAFAQYEKDTILSSPPFTIEGKDLYANPRGLGIPPEDKKNRISVKNGEKITINLSGIVDLTRVSYYSGGKLTWNESEKKIEVENAGSVLFYYHTQKSGESEKEWAVMTHVNYYGVARYPGATGNEVTNGQTITITSDADLEKEIGFFEEMRGMEIYWQKDLYNSGTWTIFADETQNIKNMKLSAILDQAEGQKTFKLRISTSDGTPNSENGHRLGLVHLDITIKDLRDPKTLEVNPTIVFFPENGGSQSVRVTSNQTWNASSNQTWVSVSPASGTNDGSFTVSVEPNTSQQPRTASITVTGGGLSKTITVNQVAANPQTYSVSLSAQPAEGGSVQGAGTFNENSQVTVTATPKEGYKFVKWTENGAQVSTSASYQFQITKNRNLVAVFEPVQVQTYTVSLSAQPADGGSVQGTGTFNENSQVTVTATANNGYKFVKWTEDGVEVSTSVSYQFKITKNRNLVAMFEELPVIITAPTNFKSETLYQRDAIISWSAGGSEMEWEVNYGDHKITVNEPKATLRGLTPNTEVTAQIRAKVNGKLSEPLVATLRTEDFTAIANRIPHLYGMKESFAVGEMLPIFWKDLEHLPSAITYNLSITSTPENDTKLFAPLPEAIQFTEKGSFVLTIKFEGHEEFEEISYLIEVK